MNALILLAALAASPTISLEHKGTLREGLQELARKGGLNLVATGSLDEPAVIHLKDITAEEALASVAAAYGLQLKKEGRLWVIKPASPIPAIAAVPPVPPVPPVAPTAPVSLALPHSTKSAGEEDEGEVALAHAEAMREEAQALREKAEELREARRDEVEAAKEQARAHIEAAQAHAKSEEDLVNMNGPVTVKANQRVESAISYGGTVTIEENARVDGDVVSFGGDVILQENSRVDGDAVSFGGKVTKAEGARVFGEEVSFGGSGLGSMVASKAVSVSRPHGDAGEDKGGSAIAAFFAQFAVLFGLGFLLMMFAPQRMKTIEAELQNAPARNGVAGLLAMFCAVPLTLFLIITLIGIPVALAFWMLAGVCTLMGLVAVANVLGSRVPVPRLRRTQAIALAVGLLAMLLVARIPVLGPLLMSGAVFVSLGAIIRTRIGQRGQGMPIAAGFIDSSPSRPSV